MNIQVVSYGRIILIAALIIQAVPGISQINQNGNSEDEVRIVIRNGFQFLDAVISFENGETEISPEAEAELKKINEFMRLNPSSDVEIRGFPDEELVTDEDYNIATERANRIKTRLVMEGIRTERLTVKPFIDFEEIRGLPAQKDWRSSHMVEFRIKGGEEYEAKLEEELVARFEVYNKEHENLIASNEEMQIETFGELNDDHNPDNVPDAYDKLMKELADIDKKIVYFSKKSAAIEKPYNETVDSILMCLKIHPRVKIEITGYAGKKDGKKLLRVMPKARAEAISDVFKNNNIDVSRIKVKSGGLFNATKDKSIDPEKEMRATFKMVPVESRRVTPPKPQLNGAPPKSLTKATEDYNPSVPDKPATQQSEDDPYAELRNESEGEVAENSNSQLTDKSVPNKETETENGKSDAEPLKAKDNITTEKSGQLGKNQSAASGPVSSGISYKVQVGAFGAPIKSSHQIYSKIDIPIAEENNGDGFIRYVCGNFVSKEEADKYKAKARANGIKDAFVVPYNNGKRISAGELSRLLKK